MKAIDKFFDEHYKWKAEKEKHRDRTLRLRRAANKEFYEENKKWFKMLDTIGVILISLNIIALLITGLLVVKSDPGRIFVEGNPTQCVWNGWSCHTNGWSIIIPVLKQFIIWALLIVGYLFIRNHTFSYTGMWILTAIIIFYAVSISWDAVNDIGLYLGKVLFGVKV
jgi:hypothetical protein